MFVTREITLRPLGGKDWRIQEALVYRGKWQIFVVPAGFVTDLASVPDYANWLLPAADQAYLLAAVLHDYLCRVEIPAGRMSSRDTDGLFRRVLEEEGVGYVKAHLMWTGVRWNSLTQDSRRNVHDFLKDFPAVLGWSLVGLPIIALGATGAVFGVALLSAFERLAKLFIEERMTRNELRRRT